MARTRGPMWTSLNRSIGGEVGSTCGYRGGGLGGPDVEKGAGASVWVGGWNPK